MHSYAVGDAVYVDGCDDIWWVFGVSGSFIGVERGVGTRLERRENIRPVEIDPYNLEPHYYMPEW